MFTVLLSLIPSPDFFHQSAVPWGFVLFCAVVLAVLHLRLHQP
jgi:hypothetical protein